MKLQRPSPPVLLPTNPTLVSLSLRQRSVSIFLTLSLVPVCLSLVLFVSSRSLSHREYLKTRRALLWQIRLTPPWWRRSSVVSIPRYIYFSLQETRIIWMDKWLVPLSDLLTPFCFVLHVAPEDWIISSDTRVAPPWASSSCSTTIVNSSKNLS